MAFSVAIHMALFVIAGWLLNNDTVPSVINSPLIVSIDTYSTVGDTAQNNRVVPQAESEAVSPAENRAASRAADTPSEDLKPVEMVIAAESSSLDPHAETGVTHAENGAAVVPENFALEAGLAAPVEDTSDPASELVTTIESGEPVIIVGVSEPERQHLAQATLTQKQERMIHRKIKEWTEDLHKMPDEASGLTWKYKGQEYLAKFEWSPAADEMGIQRVIVEISTEEDGKRLSSEVHMKQLAFSSFAQFVNRWDSNVEIHNDELDGRFHSNTAINLTYDPKVKPLFHGRVTTTSRRVNITSNRGPRRHEQIFLGGLVTGVRSIRLPKHFLPFPGEGGIADDQVHFFGEDTRIKFRDDGSFVWQAIESESPRQLATLSGDTTYLIADRKVSMHVQGTVNGKVLVYSPERIVIEDDLLYAQNPEKVPDADDYLGLVSDKYVDIAPPDITGPGDLLIHAAIYAKRRFAVREFRINEGALLHLYGSLAVGSLSATEPRYSTRIRFDRRFEDLRPPGFPMTDRYEVDSWTNIWNVEPIE